MRLQAPRPSRVPVPAGTRRHTDPRFAEYRATGDRAVRNALVEDHHWVALHCVRRFRRSSEPQGDLEQVAMVGLVRAVDGFDPVYGYAFTTYAVPTIMGELRHHFRDRTWAVRVPRRVKERYLAVKDCADEMQHELGRAPTVAELADRCDLSVDEALDALAAGAAYRSVQLVFDDVDDEPHDHLGLLGVDEPGYATTEARTIVPDLLATLPSDRERELVRLRFVERMSQSEIAAALGLSQVHVSRLLRTSLTTMRERLVS